MDQMQNGDVVGVHVQAWLYVQGLAVACWSVAQLHKLSNR